MVIDQNVFDLPRRDCPREREILDAAIDDNHEVSTPFLLTNTAVKRKVPNFWGKYYNTKWRPFRFLIALVRRNKMETHE